MTLTVGSLFSGIEGFGKGFEDAGMKVVWQVEIDPDARRVLRHHWPDAELLEDVCKVGKKNLKPVDVICGGFPCQDLSVAGKRAGLKGKRSSLFFQFMRIVNELRPSVVVVENVPGLRSSPPKDPGRDFETILQTVAALRVYECGWTGLDARWFGVPQRRQRVFYVLTHKRLGAGCAAEILALTSRREGHFATGQEAESDVAGTLGGCTNGAGWGGDPDRAGAYIASSVKPGHYRASGNLSGENMVVSGPLQAHAKRHGHATTTQQAAESDQLVTAFGGNNTSGPIDVATAVNACKTASGRQDFETETFIVKSANSHDKQNRAIPTDIARCLDGAGGLAASQGGTVVCESLQAQGIMRPKEGQDACAQEGDARTLLRILRGKAGEKAFAEWGLGILDSLQQAEVLRPNVHGEVIRRTPQRIRRLVPRPRRSTGDLPEGAVLKVWSAECSRRASQEWGLAEQFARQLGAYLSLLSQPGPPQAEALFSLWESAEEPGVLRQALSAFQEVWRPADAQEKPTFATDKAGKLADSENGGLGVGQRMLVRRLTPL